MSCNRCEGISDTYLGIVRGMEAEMKRNIERTAAARKKAEAEGREYCSGRNYPNCCHTHSESWYNCAG